ncbi:MAG: NUDIX hydrolase [Desulfobacterales bacterium]
MEPIPVILEKTETLAETAFLRLIRVFYHIPGQKARSWVMATRRLRPLCLGGSAAAPDAVVIAAYHAERGRLVLTREYRAPLGGFEYGFPAGLVESEESIEEAVRRELFEETGLEVTRFTGKSPPLFSSAGMTDESVVMVGVECRGEPLRRGGIDSEIIEVRLVSPAEAGALCNDAALLFDAKAWLVARRFAVSGRVEL